MRIINKLIMRARGQIPTEDLIKKGMKVGTHFSRRNSTSFDASHAYMITIGNHVTFAGETVRKLKTQSNQPRYIAVKNLTDHHIMCRNSKQNEFSDSLRGYCTGT